MVGVSFERTTADPLIFCQNQPATFANLGEPFLILNILLEIVVVQMDGRSRLYQRTRDLLSQ